MKLGKRLAVGIAGVDCIRRALQQSGEQIPFILLESDQLVFVFVSKTSAFPLVKKTAQNLKRLREILERGGLAAFFDAAIRLVVTPVFISANVDAIARMKEKCVRINSPAAILGAIDACENFDVRDRISQITHNTLLISGSEDVMSPIHLAEQIHRSIKGSKWKIMRDVGYNLLIPENVPRLAQIILGFLKRH